MRSKTCIKKGNLRVSLQNVIAPAGWAILCRLFAHEHLISRKSYQLWHWLPLASTLPGILSDTAALLIFTQRKTYCMYWYCLVSVCSGHFVQHNHQFCWHFRLFPVRYWVNCKDKCITAAKIQRNCYSVLNVFFFFYALDLTPLSAYWRDLIYLQP